MYLFFFQGTRFLENLVSPKADRLVQKYNDAFDKLLQDFHDMATRDTLVVVHRIWDDFVPKIDDLRESLSKDPLSNLPDI